MRNETESSQIVLSLIPFFLTYSDVGYDDKRVSLIRRIDFAWALEEEDDLKTKKQKKSSKESSEQWPWKGMVENLQLAHQELSVIIDLINTVSDYVLTRYDNFLVKIVWYRMDFCRAFKILTWVMGFFFKNFC